MAAVVEDAVIGLVRQQVDRAPVPRRGGLEDSSETIERRARIDLSGRVVRRVDDDGARPRGDRPLDGRHVDVERPHVDAYLHRQQAEALRDAVVEEPGRREIDDLVAFVADGAHGDLEAGERAGRQRDVFRSEPDTPVLGERGDDRAPRLGHIHVVREPVLAPGLAPLLDRSHVFGERHLLRIAGDEVGDPGSRSTRAEPLEELEKLLMRGEQGVHLARNRPHFHAVANAMARV